MDLDHPKILANSIILKKTICNKNRPMELNSVIDLYDQFDRRKHEYSLCILSWCGVFRLYFAPGTIRLCR